MFVKVLYGYIRMCALRAPSQSVREEADPAREEADAGAAREGGVRASAAPALHQTLLHVPRQRPTLYPSLYDTRTLSLSSLVYTVQYTVPSEHVSYTLPYMFSIQYPYITLD